MIVIERRTERPDLLAAVMEATYWTSKTPSLRLDVPIEITGVLGAFAYGGGWHPFAAGSADGRGTLAEFYRRYRPSTLREAYDIDEPGVGGDLAPSGTPSFRAVRKPPGPEGGLEASDGDSRYGPVSARKLDHEYEGLTATCASIRRQGYRPDRYGDAAGYFLRRRDEVRFFVQGAKHRAAILAHLGLVFVPVLMRPGCPRIVESADSRHWPLIRNGAIEEALARSVFDRYVDWDGTQQQRFCLSPPSRSHLPA